MEGLALHLLELGLQVGRLLGELGDQLPAGGLGLHEGDLLLHDADPLGVLVGALADALLDGVHDALQGDRLGVEVGDDVSLGGGDVVVLHGS